MKFIRVFLTTIVLGVSAAPAYSAPVFSLSDGLLIGAKGVLVGGVSYDVIFTDGTCVDLYSGCATSSVLPFDYDGAIAATNALIEQVLVDNDLGAFNTNPNLTRGCPGFRDDCYIRTPFQVDVGGGASLWVSSVLARNDWWTFGIGIGTESIPIEFDSSDNRWRTWAVWSPSVNTVPVPSSSLLFGTALIGLMLSRRRVPMTAPQV